MKGKLLNYFLYFSIFIFLASLTSFFLISYLKPSPVAGLKIELLGAKEVNSMEDSAYTLVIKNNSNQDLTSVNLKINLSKGVFFTDKHNEKEKSTFIGELKAKQKNEQGLNLFFINEGGLKENIQIVLTYKIKGRPAVFEKKEDFFILVKNPPIKVQFYLPQSVYVNQEFQSLLKIINLTNKKLENVRIIVEPPSYFTLISSFPQSENYYYDINILNPSETKNITINGQIQNINSNGIFSAKVEFGFLNLTYSLSKEIAKTNVLENPVAIYIATTPESNSIPIGSNLFYSVTIVNKSQSVLENGEVNIIFEGPFDFSSLSSDGYFSALDNVLKWNARNKPELLTLKPKDEVKVNFSISLYQSYPVFSQNNKNFTAKIKVEFKTPTIPNEVSESGKEYVVFQLDEKKIIGDITIDSWVVYNDNIFSNSGPFPLEPNQPTFLTWHLKIKTIGEDFENFSLSTKLPMGVNFADKVGGDAILDNLKFDPRTGVFIYSLNKLPANLGYIEKEIDLAFQLVVIPPANTDLSGFIIIPPVQYSARGMFSGAQLNNTLREIYVSQISQ